MLIELTRAGQRALVNKDQLSEWLGMGWRRKGEDVVEVEAPKPKRTRKKSAKTQEKAAE